MILRLPSSPETLVDDRFSLADMETDEAVPFWSIGELKLIDALDTIAVTLRGRADSDNASLRRFLDTQWDSPSFFDKTWPRCVEIALEMPVLFPEGYLRPLAAERPTQLYTPRQITCLVIHQFLCTFPKLPWVSIGDEDNSQDLHIWYAGDQPHPNAVSAYLTALLVFLDRASSGAVLPNPISMTLYTAPSVPRIDSRTVFQRIVISDLNTPSVNTSLLGLPSGACVISANSHIGFGRTASQEEMHVACTPQSLPAKLFTPPLKDNEVMVLRGCESVIELTGYARNAELASIIPAGKHDWSRRTMLFMDALALDNYDTTTSTPDLLPGNVDRELTKAYTAFASYGDAAPYETVVTGHWGCRAFGGNREIKSIIQWCAASLAGGDSFASDFGRLTSRAIAHRWTVHAVIEILRQMEPTDPERLSAFRNVSRILDG
ncbi:hypothetical protein DFH06DRAFT_1266769 [Mycena polygramma]|nr:hypothetical protein DFH06DRAFT_1266769 [Mycena polygramma]